jgi:chemotaxis signal transduction protein
MMTETQLSQFSYLLRCDVGDESYGVDMTYVQSIQRTDRMRINNEGNTLPDGDREIPVISLIRKLGRSHEGNQSSDGEDQRRGSERIIVFAPPESGRREEGIGGGHKWGILVDRVSQVIEVASDWIHPLPDILVDPSSEYFHGVVKLEDELFLLLSSERLDPYTRREKHSEEATHQLARIDRRPMRPAADLAKGSFARSHDVSNRPRQMVVFSMEEIDDGDRPLMFGLSITQVPEILESMPMIPVPAGPDFASGLFFWRGVPVPVINLASRMVSDSTSPTMPSGPTRLIITRDKANGRPNQGRSNSPLGKPSDGEKVESGVIAAFIIQPNIRIFHLPFDHRPSTRNLPLNPQMIRGMVELEDETLVIPDIRAILTRDF